MSNPPVQPPNPNEPEPGGQPQAPQYGQPAPVAPQYGQNSPPAPQFGQNAPQFGQQPYGQSPYAQYPSEQPQGQGPVGIQKQVNIAFWLIIGAGAVWVISLLLAIPTLDDPAMRNVFEKQMAAGGTDVKFDDIKGVVAGAIVVFAIISAGLYALVAFNVRKGKNWARILGTVFAAISLLSILPLGLGTLAVVLGIAAIVLLYLPANAPYFRKQQPFANLYGQPGNPYGR